MIQEWVKAGLAAAERRGRAGGRPPVIVDEKPEAIPEARIVDRQRPAHQRLGLGEAVGGLKELGQVVEGGGRIGVVS